MAADYITHFLKETLVFDFFDFDILPNLLPYATIFLTEKESSIL